MKIEKIEELFDEFALYVYQGGGMMDLEDFTQAISQAELVWYRKLDSKLKFIYDTDIKVFGKIIDKNADN